MNRAIAFDLDGTLIDVSLRDYKIYADIVTQLGGKPLVYSFYWSLRQAKTDIHQILADSGVTNSDYVSSFLSKRKALMESSEYLSLDSLFPSTSEVLNKLSETFDIHILTIRHNKQNTEDQLRAFGFDRFKYHIVEGNKEEQMRLIPNLCFMVGDTENDILPANILNVKSIAVTTGIRNKELLLEMNPSYIVDTLSEILELLSYGK